MKEILCCVDHETICDLGMCKNCTKFSKDEIDLALKKKCDEYCRINNEYMNFLNSYRREYIPSCKYGCTHCVYDPEYIKAHHPDWYKVLGSPTDCVTCEDGDEFDDEDK